MSIDTQPHSPSVQSIRPQQSSLSVHEVLAAAQHASGGGSTGASGSRCEEQVSPSQHMPEPLHEARASMHIIMPSSGRQKNVSQVKPSPHSELSRQKLPSRPA